VKFTNIDDSTKAYAGAREKGLELHGVPVRMGWGKLEEKKVEAALPPTRNLWVGNLAESVTELDLKRHFSQCGSVERVRLLQQKNCGFVMMATLEQANHARNALNGTTVNGTQIKINFGKDGLEDELAGPKLMPIASAQVKQADPPPPRGPAPSDASLKSIIDKTAAHVAKNGVAFEEALRQRKTQDPKFRFLNSTSEYNAYYKWAMWKERNPNASAELVAAAIVAAARQQAAEQPPAQLALQEALKGEDKAKLESLLEALQATKESIKEAKNWIMNRPTNAASIAETLRDHVGRTEHFENRLNVIYLINDVLHHSVRQRVGESDEFSDALQQHVVDIFRTTCQAQNIENQERAFKVLRLWASKGIYSPALISQFESEILGEAESKKRSTESQASDSDMHRDRRQRLEE
jgi:hypothetical protein